jgi:putative ABC transport system permease protein
MDNLVVNNIRQRPLRALVSVAGVGLGVCLVMLFTGLSRGMSNDLQRRSSNLRAEIIFTRPGGMELTTSSASLSTKYVDALRQIEGVESAVPVIRYVFQGGRFGFEQVEGVEWDAFAAQNEMRLAEGRAPASLDEVVIDETKARNGKTGVGDALSVFGGQPYRVVGIYQPEAGARVKMSLAAMQDVMQSPGRCSYIFVKAKPGVDAAELARRIDSDPETTGNKIQFTQDLPMFNFEKSVPYLGVFLRALVALAAVVSALVVMLAMYTTITERTREIGMLKALGASRGYIVSTIEREALLISLLGLAFGFAASLAAKIVIQRAYGLPFDYEWTWALVAAGIGVGGGLLGALYPAVRAAGLDPVNALSYE